MFAGIVLTPRTIIDRLTDSILKDLIDATSMSILWRKYWKMDSRDVHSIYPKLKDRSFCDNLVRNLTIGESLVLLVSGENIYDTLTEAKGKFQVVGCDNRKIGGLRLKYWPCRELVKAQINHPANDLFFEYRVHTTDSLEETINLLAICMDDRDIEELCTIAPGLYSEVKNKKALMI